MKHASIKIILAASIASLSAIALQTAWADGHSSGGAAAERQALMKNVGAATKVAAGMVKGEVAFELAAAQMAMATMNSAALGFGYMFPEGSETGAKTEASPKIWSDNEGFQKLVAKFAADTSGKVTDLASLKEAFGAAASNCGTCHKAYRVKN
ncbi:cytochrome c [Ahrensia sp. R2A130]|uniref:c-type cytochrome n=1 Tax=Ahrensia sp. R2A130 TaxID=744979 RepID=UPI0001E0C34C|nr:cytochrome c [Ahrensia sp. R2A130]EFL89425.1 cytochrome c class II [Ahrensia sp. R2A130]